MHGLERPETLSAERQAAWDRLLARLEKGVTVGVSNDEVRIRAGFTNIVASVLKRQQRVADFAAFARGVIFVKPGARADPAAWGRSEYRAGFRDLRLPQGIWCRAHVNAPTGDPV